MRHATPTILESLEALWAVLPITGSANYEMAVRGFLMALDGISPEYVAEAVKRFIQGHVKRERHAFCPSAPELAIEARRLQTEARVKQAMETRRLPKPTEPVSVISEQERAEMYAKTQKLIENMKRGMLMPTSKTQGK